MIYYGQNHTRNYWGAQGASHPLKKFSPPLEKCVGHSSKILEII